MDWKKEKFLELTKQNEQDQEYSTRLINHDFFFGWEQFKGQFPDLLMGYVLVD